MKSKMVRMAKDLIGQALGRYRIIEKIGEGGMGVVFKATDERLLRTVALKVLGDGVVNDDERRLRFLREARIAASITHPNIATVYDVGETEDGHIYIAMELVLGSSLRHRLQQGPLPLATGLRIAKDLTRALIKAHELGIIHRDLKPDNVMVGENLEVKVLDFGLAKPIELPLPSTVEGSEIERGSVVTEEGHILGTPGYMSPEQAAGRAVDERTDIFALGVMLYEMAAGGRPFPGATAIEIIIATARDEPARLSRVTTDASPALARAIFRCLEKNADARYGSARELMGALDDVGDLDPAGALGSPAKASAREVFGLPTQQSLVRSADLAPPRRRGRRWWFVAALGAVAALSTLGFRFIGSRSTPSRDATSVPAPHATSITDQPPPSSSNRALLSEYAAGLQALRDDDWGVAEAHFLRVVELDPFLALGHLRLAMAAEGTLDESLRREHYAKAVGLRSQLGPRDEGMMEALEPVLQRLREDRAEAVKRLYLLSERYPADAEIHGWLAMLQESNAAGLAAADRGNALDPRDGQAWQSRGNILAGLGRADDARLAYERCGAVSPGSSECYLGLIWVDAMEGKCADAERDARRAVDRNPHLAGNLACVMYGAGRPIEAVREVLDQSYAAFEASSPMQWQRIVDQCRVALVSGDFVRARTLAEQYQALVDSDVHAVFRDHLVPALILVGIARETGDDAQAFRVAWSFTSRSDTWSKSTQGDGGIEASLWLAKQAVRAGGLSQGEFVSRRATWIQEERRNIASTGLTWVYAFGATAETADEAKSALAVLPSFTPLSSFVYYAGIPDAEIGSTYLLAGQVDDAIPYLARAVANCGGFRHPFVHTRAELQLGQALESKGDAKGACGAYLKVLDRWGNAKPRSMSAEKAKARRKALSCAK